MMTPIIHSFVTLLCLLETITDFCQKLITLLHGLLYGRQSSIAGRIRADRRRWLAVHQLKWRSFDGLLVGRIIAKFCPR
jgi:hypothetical protein